MGIHTLQELSLLKGEDMATVLTTVRNNTTQLYGIWSAEMMDQKTSQQEKTEWEFLELVCDT